MTAAAIDSTTRRAHTAIVAAGACAAIALLAIVGGGDGARLALLGGVLCVSLLVDVEVPTGGSVPAGHAVVIALAFELAAGEFAAVAAVALLGLLAAVEVGVGSRRSVPDIARVGLSLTVAGVVAVLTRPLASHSAAPSDVWLVPIIAIGGAYLFADVLVERLQGGRRRVNWRRALPVYVSLVCIGALLAMSSGWLVAFASLPLFITRYSFQRYAAARRTYQQTIQALGIVPELAGHVGLGHGERTAFYAAALAEDLGLGETAANVETAARLHHIGHVSVPDCTDTHPYVEDALIAAAGARILRDSGFLPEIASLVERLGGPDVEHDDLPTAIVRVASAFDDLVGEDEERARGALAILTARDEGVAWADAVRALRVRCEGERSFVDSAIARGLPLTTAAAEAEEQHA